MPMNDWMSELTTIEKIYWITAIAASVFFVIQMIMTFVMGDMDGDVGGDTDFDVEADTGIAFQFFTFRNLVAFFTVFGWTGLGCIASGYTTETTIIVSVVSGLIMMVIMSTLFYLLSRMTDSGTLNMNNAKGKTGTVYIPIHAKRGSMGKVQVKIQGSLRELDAITDEENDLSTGMVVSVKEVLDGNILLVETSK